MRKLLLQALLILLTAAIALAIGYLFTAQWLGGEVSTIDPGPALGPL